MTTQIAEQAGKSFNLVRNPSLWPGTATDQLVENLVTLSLYLGVHYTEELFEEFLPFYWFAAEDDQGQRSRFFRVSRAR
jgi:hypothetical protein